MTRLIDVRETPIAASEVEAAVAHPGAGAVALFIGRVRDHNEGKTVTRLEYEAYSSMAVREMVRIVDAIERRFPQTRLSVLHRTGSLEVGDAAIVGAASAAHRAEAFGACRQLIDDIKANVPIWKREHGPDGPYWVGWQDARCSGGHEHAEPTASMSSVRHAHDSHTHDTHASAGSVGEFAANATLQQHRIICVTVSDTRDASNDKSGNAADQLLTAAGAIVERHWVRDDPTEISNLISRVITTHPDAVFLTGGTGIGPRDVTVEAVAPLLERQLDGFGERFREMSWQTIGTRALLSRAIAGTVGNTVIFAVPGSPHAVRLALEELIIPLLPHAHSMLRGGGH
ncbi:MAG TPA: molybdenum cofactor biosynthesis protein MoaE [Polyangiaceae bacterium]